MSYRGPLAGQRVFEDAHRSEDSSIKKSVESILVVREHPMASVGVGRGRPGCERPSARRLSTSSQGLTTDEQGESGRRSSLVLSRHAGQVWLQLSTGSSPERYSLEPSTPC